VTIVNLLGWHGTVLRVENGSDAWFHALPWPDDENATDLAIDLPRDGVDQPVQVDWFVVEQAATRGCVQLRRDGQYLTAEPSACFVHFARDLAGPLETFLPVAPAIVSRLRAVLAGPVRIAETGAVCAATRADRFGIAVQGREFPIATASIAADGGLLLQGVGGAITVVPLAPPGPAARTPIPFLPAHPRLAADGADFLAGESRTMLLEAAEEFAYAPTTLSDADQIWMQQKPWFPDRQYWGSRQARCEIGRTRDAFVLMTRGQEGTIFGRDGLFTDPMFLDAVPLHGGGVLSRHGRQVFIDTAALRDAPRLEGPHAVFYGGLLSNYFHWLVEALIPLSIQAPHLPAGTKLLFAGAMGEAGGSAMQGMLDDWGFGGMDRAIVHAPVCHVEEVFWLRNRSLDMDGVPAGLLGQARARALAALPPGADAAPDARLYIRRIATRRVRNDDAVEDAVRALGFTVHELPGLSPREQMALFRTAAFVIAPHGADMANLLFCRPGTQVIEMTPDVQFRSLYAHISDKLGLSHAVLPCPALTADFDGDFHVDPARLTALFHVMQARR
jgi:hypothetical protein